MGCGCGSEVKATPSVRADNSNMVFEYTGKTNMKVISPKTGIRYSFEAPGSQVTVDPRDQAMMLQVSDLRLVR